MYLQHGLDIAEGGLLPAQLQEALWSLYEQLTLAVVDLLHYLWHAGNVVLLGAIAPVRMFMNDKQVRRADGPVVRGLDLQKRTRDLAGEEF